MRRLSDVQLHIGDHSFGVRISKVGQEYCRPDKKHEGLARSYYSLHFISDGGGTLVVNGKKVFLKRGMAFLLYAGESHEYYPDAMMPWSYVWVNFTVDGDADAFVKMLGFTRDRPYVMFDDYAQLAGYFISMHNGISGGVLQDLICTGYFSLIVSVFVAEHMRRIGSASENQQRKDFMRIVTYINSNYPLNLTIGQIADDMYVSEKQLLCYFKKYIDMTPVDYINRFRVSNACNYFKTLHVGVEEAARMVGIDNPKYFTRMFVKWKGVSPREYKKNCASDNPFDWLEEKNIDSGW